MSIHSVKAYQREVEEDRRFGGSANELSIRDGFKNLLNEYARAKGLRLIYELPFKTAAGKSVKPDGTLKDSLQNSWGFWESKDEADDIDEEIRKKFAKGYPNDNILFEDSHTAVLYQHTSEVSRADMQDAEQLHELITKFINYERPEVKSFREAIEAFKEHIPHVTKALREIIEAQGQNKAYIKKRNEFLELSKEAINPDVTIEDVREMLIQHILTADIFNTIFDEPHFHRENNVAKELETVLDTFFTGTIRRQTLGSIKHYYDVINARAADIADHHEKQKFLKVVYETFYKSYNPKAADRLGVVYTPNEIVRFMIESTDYLLNQHFGKFLEDKGVEILDPATGTGTFICDLIDYISPHKLEYKYREELHANEVAILPYYISNLNIEFTYKQRMKKYEEYVNLCFMDTLDNLGFKRARQNDLFNPFTEENSKRIMRQNAKKISVVIGNPPYNAKQENYNFQNANRTYEEIDERIKETYVKQGTAQNQIVLFDMYVRFFRWAADRIAKNGIIAFVSNNSFVDGKTFDGFRKVAAKEFNEIHIVNLKGNARTSGERRRQEAGNVFDDQIRVGIAIYFFIKKEGLKGCKVFYNEIEDYAKSDRKRAFLNENKFKNLPFEHINPDKKGNWIDQTDNDFEKLLPLIDKNVKNGKSDKAIFKLFSRGVGTYRDEWVYDLNKNTLEEKIRFFTDIYNQTVGNPKYENKNSIKWDRELDKYRERAIEKRFNAEQVVLGTYRPFVKQYLYFDKHFNGMTYQWFDIYKAKENNQYVAINAPGNTKGFYTLSANEIVDLHFTGDSQCIPFYSYDEHGNRQDNITDWGLNKFQKEYKDKGITREDIFHYVYAVLHNPEYREKYALNLKRDFPRIPFYKDFHQWAAWGKQLMGLHINYEEAKPYGLERVDKEVEADTLKVKLKANKEKGTIELDEQTHLYGMPAEAWDYKLGNRSALEWILDQYKEKKPRDKTIAEKFNTYRFADYKEQVIDLLQRVTTVSVETMKIIKEMKEVNN